MKSHGACHCGGKIVEKKYKLKEGYNNFKVFYRCQKDITHSYTEEQLADIDIQWHEAETKRLSTIMEKAGKIGV